MLAEQKVDKTSEAAERLRVAIESIQSGEDFKAWLKVASKFHTYSFGNTVMIWSQRPDATRVAGFNKWRDEFDKPVRKGERGIAIFAPMFRRFLDDEGEPHQQLAGFKVVYVFDVSQTEGPPLPEPPRPDPAALEADGVSGLTDRLIALTSSQGLALTYARLPDSMGGYYQPETKHIVLADGRSRGVTQKTWIHELAHHYSYEQLAKLDDKQYDQYRGLHEAIAEGAAFVVADHFGFDTSAYSAPYIAQWHESGDLGVAMAGVVGVAQRLIKDLSKEQ